MAPRQRLSPECERDSTGADRSKFHAPLLSFVQIACPGSCRKRATVSRTQVQAEAAAFAAVFLWPRRLHWRARPRSLTYLGYTNTGLRLGQNSKSAGNGGMAFVADTLRRGASGKSIPTQSID